MRFSKNALATFCYRNIERLEREHGFTRSNGWSQVSGKSEAINRAYGEYDAYLTIISEYDLEYPQAA